MTLLEKAKAAPTGDKHNYDTLVPVVSVLRGKGWRYRAIHEWLRLEGQHIHPNYVTFASSMSKRIKHQNSNSI